MIKNIKTSPELMDANRLIKETRVKIGEVEAQAASFASEHTKLMAKWKEGKQELENCQTRCFLNEADDNEVNSMRQQLAALREESETMGDKAKGANAALKVLHERLVDAQSAHNRIFKKLLGSIFEANINEVEQKAIEALQDLSTLHTIKSNGQFAAPVFLAETLITFNIEKEAAQRASDIMGQLKAGTA